MPARLSRAGAPPIRVPCFPQKALDERLPVGEHGGIAVSLRLKQWFYAAAGEQWTHASAFEQ